MTSARAIVDDAPETLSVQTLALGPYGATDRGVEVRDSGIGTGTERRLWDGSMPPFPAPGDPQCQKLTIDWRA